MVKRAQKRERERVCELKSNYFLIFEEYWFVNFDQNLLTFFCD